MALQVKRPESLAHALCRARECRAQGYKVAFLAGGQSLLAAMRLGMSSPELLIDLQRLPELRKIRLLHDEDNELAGDTLEIGAMLTHAELALDQQVWDFAPGMARLASGIADPQVRNMGTIGGSLANHDPAACWPAAVLACDASLQCSSGAKRADEFFTGLYDTALAQDEILVSVHFPKPLQFGYHKFEQPASRFAMVGVAVARFASGVRVAITGLGGGVRRWPEAEQALSSDWSVAALEGLALDPALAMSDLHATAEYRAQLAAVACRRVLQALDAPAGTSTIPTRTIAPTAPVSSSTTAEDGFGASVLLPASPETVWSSLLDPQVLQRCIPGCESLSLQSPEHYVARLKVGIGLLSARFEGEVSLRDLQSPHQLNLIFKGSAGPLGGGQGDTRVRLSAAPGGTRLDWRARVQASGRIAQLGNRLLEGSARKLSDEFFENLRRELSTEGGQASAVLSHLPTGWRRLLARLKAMIVPKRKEK